MCNGAQGIDAFTESSHLIINSSLIRGYVSGATFKCLSSEFSKITKNNYTPPQ